VTALTIVGEANPYGADPYFALYHLPRHASGNRLREHMGLPDHVYEQLTKVNLCPSAWSMKVARVQADKLREAGGVIVLLGSKVRAAFDGPEFFGVERFGDVYTLATLPHPSGLNRMWSAPGARERARALLREVAPEVPWGSA
jgi:hypothetical protein